MVALPNLDELFGAVTAKGDNTSEADFMTAMAAVEPWRIPDLIDFLNAKISGFGKEREVALSILIKLDPSFLRRKLPELLQPVINMCTDTSKKVRWVSSFMALST